MCEGSKTEPRYFQSLQHEFRNQLVHVEINGESGVPLTLVERAIDLCTQARRDAKAQRDDNLLYDEIWCVCDVDEHPNLDQAGKLAKENDIKIALSNPCFELWALLHLRDQTKAIDRRVLQREVKKLLDSKEEKVLPFEKLHPGYNDAIGRAKALRKTAARTGVRDPNPSTNVDELTEQIRLGGQR